MFAFEVLMLYITNERNVVAIVCTGVVVNMDIRHCGMECQNLVSL